MTLLPFFLSCSEQKLDSVEITKAINKDTETKIPPRLYQDPEKASRRQDNYHQERGQKSGTHSDGQKWYDDEWFLLSVDGGGLGLPRSSSSSSSLGRPLLLYSDIARTPQESARDPSTGSASASSGSGLARVLL